MHKSLWTLAASALLLVGCDGSSVRTDPVSEIPALTATDDQRSALANSNAILVDVLANDGQGAGNPQLTTVGTPNLGGSAVRDGNQVRYQPASNVSLQTETVSYTIADNRGQQATAIVRIDIGPATPTARDDVATVAANSGSGSLDVLPNDSANTSNGQGGLTIVAVGTTSAGGTVSTDGLSIQYAPASGDGGIVETFDYTIENADGEQASANVAVTISSIDPGSNTAPVATDDAVTLNMNSPDNRIAVLGNDMDADGDTLTLISVTSPSQGGRVRIDGDTLVYTPAVNQTGDETFTYTVSDGQVEVAATVTATIEAFTVDQMQFRPCEAELEDRQNDGRPYCVDVQIPAGFDGHTISATVFVPADGGAQASPVILHAHGFGESRFASLENPNFVMVDRVTAQALLALWHEGYWVVTYDQRGFNASIMWGNSAESSNETCSEADDSGCIDVMSPEREARDATVVIDWIVANLRDGFTVSANAAGQSTFTAPPDGAAALFAEEETNDPVLGSIGLSYGGGWQTMGSSVDRVLRPAERTADARIDAMVPVTTWFDLRYALSPNDVPKSGWLQFLTAATAAGGTTAQASGFLATAGREALVDDNVSTETFDGLLTRSPRSYCEGVGDDTLLDDGNEPALGSGVIPGSAQQNDDPVHAFFIQGQRDLLFNLNEGLDLAQCYSDANPGADVRLLVQTEGHILATAQPASYADATTGNNQIIYIDEDVVCDDVPLRTQLLITGWFRDKLGLIDRPGTPQTADSVPAVCVTHFEAGAAPISGSSFVSLDALPVGDPTPGDWTVDLDGDPDADGAQVVSFFLPQNSPGGQDGGPPPPLFAQTVLIAAEPMAVVGIPVLNLNVTAGGAPGGDPPRLFASLGVQRSGSVSVDILADQITPISGPVPNPGADCLGPQGCVVTYTYPRIDDHGVAHGELEGRIAGFGVRLQAGDALVFELRDQHPLYNLHGTQQGGYQIELSGTLALPVLPVLPEP